MNKTYRTARITKTALLLAGASLLIALSPVTSSQAEQTDAQSSFTQEQKRELDGMFRRFVKDNPELIMKSIQEFHEKMEKKAKQTSQESLEDYQKIFMSNDLPMMGNPDGDVTIVEFFDYNCGYCKKAFSDIIKLVAEDKNIRIIFQDMPILSPSSQKMAELGLAAKKQGKYFEMHKALMEYRGSQNKEAFLKLAGELGLDIEKLKIDAESEEVKTAISEIRKMSQALGIRGTPGFVIGDNIYPGYIGKKGLLDAVKKAREADKAK